MKDYGTVNSAAKQAGEVLRSGKATRSQKVEAVKVLGKAVAEESSKKVVEHVAKQAKEALKDPEQRAAIADAAKKVGVPLAKATAVGAAIAATLAVGGAALTSQREKEAKRWADTQLSLTKKRLGAALTADQAATLWQQYYQHALKQPVQNPFVGK